MGERAEQRRQSFYLIARPAGDVYLHHAVTPFRFSNSLLTSAHPSPTEEKNAHETKEVNERTRTTRARIYSSDKQAKTIPEQTPRN